MSGRRRSLIALALCTAMLAQGAHADDDRLPAERLDPALAKVQFSRATGASAPPARAIGTYAKGCLAGAVELSADGANFQAMRLSRGRRWGHPATIAFVKDLAGAAPVLGLGGILVGDIGQPRGGPMLFGHTSHQVGLDVDVWFAPMPEPRLDEASRETFPFVTVLTPAGDAIDPARFTRSVAALLETAARDDRVARIFVHPAVKRALCHATWSDRAFLRKVRPWYGHHEHFHVRLKCPRGASACVPQTPPPPGDGCGTALDYWFTDAPYRPKPDAGPSRPLTMERMPRRCRQLLGLPDYAVAPAAVPSPRPIPTGQPTPVPLSPQ